MRNYVMALNGAPIRRPREIAPVEHQVNALVAVDDLRHAQIAGEAQQRKGLVPVETRTLAYDVEHLPQRDLHADVEVRVEGHRDHVRRRFGARPLEWHV